MQGVSLGKSVFRNNIVGAQREHGCVIYVCSAVSFQRDGTRGHHKISNIQTDVIISADIFAQFMIDDRNIRLIFTEADLGLRRYKIKNRFVSFQKRACNNFPIRMRQRRAIIDFFSTAYMHAQWSRNDLQSFGNKFQGIRRGNVFTVFVNDPNRACHGNHVCGIQVIIIICKFNRLKLVTVDQLDVRFRLLAVR